MPKKRSKGKAKASQASSAPQRSLKELRVIYDAGRADAVIMASLTEQEQIRLQDSFAIERAKMQKESARLERERIRLEAVLEKQDRIKARRQVEIALHEPNGLAHSSTPSTKEPKVHVRYGGNRFCCLEMTHECSSRGRVREVLCQHEICTRARIERISWKEMDSIEYYKTRVYTEKSDRRREALRKQRDVELARIIREEDEERYLKARKAAYNTKIAKDVAEKEVVATLGDVELTTAEQSDHTTTLDEDYTSAIDNEQDYSQLGKDIISKLASMGKATPEMTLQLMNINAAMFSAHGSPVPNESTDTMEKLRVVVNKTARQCTSPGEAIKAPSYLQYETTEVSGEHQDHDGECEGKNRARARVQEIIDGEGGMNLYCWIAENVRRTALEDHSKDPLELFDSFELDFNSIGPMPSGLVRALENAKVGLQDMSEKKTPDQTSMKIVQEDEEHVLRTATASDDPFVSCEDWEIRKLSFIPEATPSEDYEGESDEYETADEGEEYETAEEGEDEGEPEDLV